MTDSSATTMSSRSQGDAKEPRSDTSTWLVALWRSLASAVRPPRVRRVLADSSPRRMGATDSILLSTSNQTQLGENHQNASPMLRRRRPPRPRNKTDCKLCHRPIDCVDEQRARRQEGRGHTVCTMSTPATRPALTGGRRAITRSAQYTSNNAAQAAQPQVRRGINSPSRGYGRLASQSQVASRCLYQQERMYTTLNKASPGGSSAIDDETRRPNRPLNTTTLDTRRAFSSSKRDFYDVLGVAKGSGKGDIKKAYFQLAKKYHPDTNKVSESQSCTKSRRSSSKNTTNHQNGTIVKR